MLREEGYMNDMNGIMGKSADKVGVLKIVDFNSVGC